MYVVKWQNKFLYNIRDTEVCWTPKITNAKKLNKQQAEELCEKITGLFGVVVEVVEL